MYLSHCPLQEIFGPVLTVYVYPENEYKDVLRLIDGTSPYALTGAVYAHDKYVTQVIFFVTQVIFVKIYLTLLSMYRKIVLVLSLLSLNNFIVKNDCENDLSGMWWKKLAGSFGMLLGTTM